MKYIQSKRQAIAVNSYWWRPKIHGNQTMSEETNFDLSWCQN